MHRTLGVSGKMVDLGLRNRCPDPVFPEKAQSLAGPHNWWWDRMGRGAGMRNSLDADSEHIQLSGEPCPIAVHLAGDVMRSSKGHCIILIEQLL